MAATVIESLGVYLPPKEVTTAEILAGCKQPLAIPLEAVTGIRSRRMAGDGEFSIDLAEKAIADCLAGSRFTPRDIDLLICANISRYDGPNSTVYFEPSTALRLRARWGFDNALAFDVSNACAGMFTAVLVADALIQAGMGRRAMIVSGEYITHLTRTAQQEIEGPFDDRLAGLTLGDAGAAVILEAAPGDEAGFHLIDLYTLGKYCGCCVVKPTDQPHGGGVMRTDMVRLTAVAIQQSNAYLPRVLRQSGWPTEAIQHVLHHQTSRKSLEGSLRALSQQLGDPSWLGKNLINNLGERGNTASTTHFVALKDHIQSGAIRSGDGVLFGVFGSGITIGSALYTFDDLPDRLRRQVATSGKILGADIPPGRHGQPVGAALRGGPGLRVEAVGTASGNGQTADNTIDLAACAVEDCFRRSAHGLRDVDLFLHIGTYPSEYMVEPATATMVLGKVSFQPENKSAGDSKVLAFDVLNGGLGFLTACYVAGGMVAARRCRTVLITAAEVELNRRDRPDELRGIRETGSAVLLRESSGRRTGFGRFLFRYATEHIHALTVHALQGERYPYLVCRKDANLEALYLRCIVEAVDELLRAEGLNLSGVKVVLPPQLSSAFVSNLGRALGCRPGQLVNVAGDGPDLFTSSTPYALQAVLAGGLAGPGDIGLVIEAAAGIQVGVAVYYF